jgi:hypothetical protein
MDLTNADDQALRSATTADLLAVRDRLVTEAEALMGASRTQEAVAVLRQLAQTTIDDTTLKRTDPFLPLIAGDRRVVATCDPSRMPRADEVVIVYGNYPHVFANVVVNNPMKRHIADFWTFHHDRVEYDHRWDGVDQIYVINVDERRDRYDAILRELSNARAPMDRVSRIPAVKMDRTLPQSVAGPLACLRSHIDALTRGADSRFRHILVLEDDFCFTSDLDAHLTDLATFFERRYDYWICLLSTSKYGPIVPKDDLISLSFQYCTNAGAYLLSRDGVAQILPIFEHALEQLTATQDPASYAADRCWRVLQPAEKLLVFRRKFGFQASSFSDIEGSISRYLD